MDRYLWIINKKVYDFENFSHPGGDDIIANCKDMDCTDIFLSHHSLAEKNTMNRIQKYYVGTVGDSSNNTPFFRKLKSLNDVFLYFIWGVVILALSYYIFI